MMFSLAFFVIGSFLCMMITQSMENNRLKHLNDDHLSYWEVEKIGMFSSLVEIESFKKYRNFKKLSKNYVKGNYATGNRFGAIL